MADAPSGHIAVVHEGLTVIVTIGNEARANSLDDAMLSALAQALQPASLGDARAVVLTGAGDRNFSGGVDLMARDGDALTDAVRTGERLLGRVSAAVEECPVPVICALNGNAFGGALEIAMAADWRIAARGARFGMPPARLGWVYTASGIQRFVRVAGAPATRELFLTGRSIDAEHARRIGLVNRVVDRRDLMDEARAAADAVAQGGPIAIAGMRSIIRAMGDGTPPSETAEIAERWRQRAFASRDIEEGLRAFREKRDPFFTGS
ncbi:MAG: enoyl-CoA hydratase [Thermoleophilia bacterium]|nr:enoyl-CoA hydratase [Thermoleophilia bacterium]